MTAAIVRQTLNKLGQQMGNKGDRKRQQIMAVTHQLLDEMNPWDIRITHITRRSGTSQPSFYTYFHSVEEVVFALAEQSAADYPDLSIYLQTGLKGPEGLSNIRKMVRVTFDYWDKWRGVLQVMRMLSTQKQPDFMELNNKHYIAITDLFRNKALEAQANGHLPPQINLSIASFQVSKLMEDAAHLRPNYVHACHSLEDLVNTTALMVLFYLTGKAPNKADVQAGLDLEEREMAVKSQ